jgi:hypothetical protein
MLLPNRPFFCSQSIFKSGAEQTAVPIYDRDASRRAGRMSSKHLVVKRRGMAQYRAYAVGIDGHFVGFEALVCADDAEAIEKAKRLVDGHDIELWSGDRFLIRLSRTPHVD